MKKYLFYSETSVIRYINTDNSWTLSRVTNTYFSLAMYAMKEPSTIDIILSTSTPDVLYDLRTVENNTFLLAIISNYVPKKHFQLYVVGESLYDLEHINIFYGPNVFVSVAAELPRPHRRKFMPRMFSAETDQVSLYIDQSHRFVFAYFRIREGMDAKINGRP